MIRIRELAVEDARWKLEMELQEAFLRSEMRVRVLHGIGKGILRKLTRDVARQSGFARVVESGWLSGNPGETLLDLDSPDPSTIARIMKRGS